MNDGESRAFLASLRQFFAKVGWVEHAEIEAWHLFSLAPFCGPGHTPLQLVLPGEGGAFDASVYMKMSLSALKRIKDQLFIGGCAGSDGWISIESAFSSEDERSSFGRAVDGFLSDCRKLMEVS